MLFSITSEFELKPIRTEYGVQIRWSTINPWTTEALRRRWLTFRRRHPEAIIMRDMVVFRSIVAANRVCKDFVEHEKELEIKRMKARVARCRPVG